MTAHEKAVEAAMATLVRTDAIYLSNGARAHIADCFTLDPRNAMSFGAIDEPRWHSITDVRSEEQETYIAAVLKAPFAAAISAYLASLKESGFVVVPREPTDAMIDAGAAEVRIGATEKWSPEVIVQEVHDAMLAAQEG